jgi:hypothetical protein
MATDETKSLLTKALTGHIGGELNVSEKFKFIGCEIVYREACMLAAQSPYRIDLEFLKKGLHDLKREEMNKRIQAAVDAVPESENYTAILLGYARCNDGLVGLTARSIPLVIPRAHDCITFFFGSRQEYQKYFDAHPGTFYHTTGWIERDNPNVPGSQGVMQQLGLDMTYEEMVEKYGREDADYILQTLGGGLNQYTGICYLKTDVTDETPFIDASRKEAKKRNWNFELRQGNISLLKQLFSGQWDENDFLIVPPGHKIIARNDGTILAAVPAEKE